MLYHCSFIFETLSLYDVSLDKMDSLNFFIWLLNLWSINNLLLKLTFVSTLDFWDDLPLHFSLFLEFLRYWIIVFFASIHLDLIFAYFGDTINYFSQKFVIYTFVIGRKYLNGFQNLLLFVCRNLFWTIS